MATKTIMTLNEKAIAVEDAAKLNRGAVTVALASKFPTPLITQPGEEPVGLTDPTPPPDWEGLQNFVAQELERGRQLLLEAANAYEREVQDDPNKREARAVVTSDSYQLFVTTRQILEAAVGETKALDILGVVGPTPQRPLNLLERMREASVRLRDPERLPLDLRMPGMTQSWTDLADALDIQAAELATVLDQQRAERRNADLALLVKERVQESFNNTYVGFTKLLDGLYIAADERELASRLRLTLPAANSGGEPEAGEEPSGSGPPPGVPGGPPVNEDNPVFPVAAVEVKTDSSRPRAEEPGVRPIVALPPDSLDN